MNFNVAKIAVAKQFEKMSRGDLFRTEVSKEEMYSAYLASFPPGTNLLYRERTEHDCSCCRQFIGAVGNVVAIVDGRLESIWDCQLPTCGYQAVAKAMSILVKSRSIQNEFLHTERVAGTDKNFEQLVEGVKTWEHFFVNIPHRFIKSKKDIGPVLSETRSTRDVFLRGLNEISLDAIATLIELIDQQSIYRGDEHSFTVKSFLANKKTFDRLGTGKEKDAFVWATDRP